MISPRVRAPALISICLLFVLILTSVVAQERLVGVRAGDWFKYGEITINWSSNDPNATFPPSDWEWLETLNETEWMNMSVVGVSLTNIDLQTTEHFRNGTERIRSGFVTIDTGNSSMETEETMDMTLMVISANLTANHTVYTAGAYSTWTINETTVRTYPDQVRDTNHLNMTWENSWTSNETEHRFYQTSNFYWDRSTGIFVEEYIEAISQTGMYLTTWSCSIKITESTVWTVPEFPTWTSILLPLIALTVVISVHKLRLLKRSIH